MLKDYLRQHQAELITFGIMFGISFVLTLAMTGNLSDAIAGSRRK